MAKISSSQPTLADFQFQLQRAESKGHKDIIADSKGRLKASSPTLATHLARFIKKWIFKRPTPTTETQKHTIALFRRAIKREQGTQATQVVQRTLHEFNTQNRRVDKTFYARVITTIGQEKAVREQERSLITSQVNQLVQRYPQYRKDTAEIITRSLAQVDNLHGDAARSKPFSPAQIEDIVLHIAHGN